MSRTEIFGQIIVFGVLFICVYMYLANRDTLDLKCVVSTVDGNKYCVRDRDEVNKAADLLAKTTQKCKKLVEHLF